MLLWLFSYMLVLAFPLQIISVTLWLGRIWSKVALQCGSSGLWEGFSWERIWMQISHLGVGFLFHLFIQKILMGLQGKTHFQSHACYPAGSLQDDGILLCVHHRLGWALERPVFLEDAWGHCLGALSHMDACHGWWLKSCCQRTLSKYEKEHSWEVLITNHSLALRTELQ